MKKIPVPVVVAVVVLVVALAGFVIFRAAGNASASGDVSEQAKMVMEANPKNAPAMPAGANPTQGAIGFGSKGAPRSQGTPGANTVITPPKGAKGPVTAD